MKTNEEIARGAANTWCRCFKCDGIVNHGGYKCEQPGATCHKWYDGYRTAMLALEMRKEAKENDEGYKKAKEEYDYYTIYPEDIPEGKSILTYWEALKKYDD